MAFQDKNKFLHPAMGLFFIGLAAWFEAHKRGHHFFVHDVLGQDLERGLIAVREEIGVLVLAKVYDGVLLAQSLVKFGDVDPQGLGNLDVRIQGPDHFLVLDAA